MSEQRLEPEAEDASEVEDHVAVVGMAVRLPGAGSVEEFWTNLVDGVESLTHFPLPGADHVPTAGVVADADAFDAAFFGCPPAEALILDPQHRVFLECAWEALEDAGCDPARHPGAIGVYGGCSENGYLAHLHAHRDRLPAVDDLQLRVATGVDFLTSRVAYKLGLRGPAVTVQTACSTSLVAIHLAAQALLAGECDVALAGGVSLPVEPAPGDYAPGGIISADGHCRTFDAAAAGTVAGGGAGLVVLKRLDDALADGDRVRAVLRGSAINNDASQKVGFAAPGVEGQARVIRAAQLAAGVDAGSIGYVEAHGTATPMGDPIEVTALTRAFRETSGRRGYCRLGSVKTNIGHADAAAGVAGFVKAALVVERGVVPANLHLERPNAALELATSPFVVPAATTDWPDDGRPRRAGVSAFGIGGTNAHAVLEEPPAPSSDAATAGDQLFVLSARTAPALDAASRRLADHLRTRPDLAPADVAWTLQTGRAAFPHRRTVVAASTASAAEILSDPSGVGVSTSVREPATRPVVFLFPGQGGQHVGMARELYEADATFAAALDEVCALASDALGEDLLSVLHPAAHDPDARARADRCLARMRYGQVAVLAVELALTRLWAAWGVVPAAVVGHSLGAYAAACAAGVLSWPDAVALVVERGTLLDAVPAGSMLAVPLTEAQVEDTLDERDRAAGLGVAVVNGPAQTVVSGPAWAVDGLRDRLGRRGLDCRPLTVATAGHSRLVEAVVPDLDAALRRCTLRPATTPFVSDTTGRWADPADLTEPAYWTRHLRAPVRFSEVLATLAGSPQGVLLEVGPGRTLGTLARQHPALGDDHLVVSTLPHPRDDVSSTTTALTAAGRLWADGVALDWAALAAGRSGRRPAKVPLPTYPFQRRRFDVTAEPDEADAAETVTAMDADESWTPAERAVAEVFRRSLGLSRVERHDSFFDLGGDSLVAAGVVARLVETTGVSVRAQALYEAPTVAALAARLDEVRREEPPTVASVPRPASAANCWLACRVRRPDAPVRLYCFPHSGGSAGEFVRWSDELSEVEVLGVQLPGRGGRLAEPGFTRMAPLVEALVAGVELVPPFAFFGHSLGALVAYEVAQALRVAGLPQPERIFASASPAPHLVRHEEVVHRLSDAELARWVRDEYGSLPPELLDDPELLATSMPAHRADFEVAETYRHGDRGPLDVPITVLGGTTDEVAPAELAAWQRHTTGASEVRLLPGDHFYLREQRPVLLALVGERLRAG